MANILKSLFGSKAERDVKEITPFINKIKAEYNRIDPLGDDDLRAETDKLRDFLHSRTDSFETEAASIREKLTDVEIAVREKEKLATRLDEIEKQIDETIEKSLTEILPTAFAIMKSTARRFTENAT